MDMITRHTAFPLALAFVVPLLLAGCFPDIPDSGTATPVDTSTTTGGTTGTGQITTGGTTGGTDDGATDGTGDEATGDTSPGDEATGDGDLGTDGNDNDVGTDGDMDTNGDGEEPADGTPVVTLWVSDTAPAVNEFISLVCLVVDSGTSPALEYEFVSSIGGGEIQHDPTSSNTASVMVPTGLFFINYQCRGINAAGPGPLSEIVRVDVAQ
jgi:hypothetical protein